jgi:flavin reductase (DIM6/NTAB) family NADH-FMN oxidoreductase RutF/acyl carrier protein
MTDTQHRDPLGLADRCGPGVDPGTFRAIMGAFPTGVAIITSYDEAGRPRGLTCSALCSVSMEPPLLLLCVNGNSGALRAIRGSGGFVVNFLREGRDWLSQLFASPSDDKFGRVAWRPSASTGLPWLAEDTIAHADCRLVSDVEAGDHAILIGLLVHGSTPTDRAQPLLYWQRNYASWPATVVPTDPPDTDPPDTGPSGTDLEVTPVMNRSDVLAEIEEFVRTQLLHGDRSAELTPTTPLLEWGVLNSMNIARLLTFIRENLGVSVPPQHIVGRHFRDLDSVTDLTVSLAGEPVG